MEHNMTDFYIDCVKTYHDTVKRLGCMQNGMIHIPDLLPIGQKTTLAYLQDHFLQSEFSHDPETYYYVVMTFVLQCGIIFADKWHKSMDRLKGTDFIDQVIADGPWDYAEPILIDAMELDADSFNLLCRHVYDNLLQKMQPHWQEKHARDYLFHAILASFQLGVSMLLDKYGIQA